MRSFVCLRGAASDPSLWVEVAGSTAAPWVGRSACPRCRCTKMRAIQKTTRQNNTMSFLLCVGTVLLLLAVFAC